MYKQIGVLLWGNVIFILLEVIVLHTTGANEHDLVEENKDFIWDDNGYLFFCLCMGRIGNRVDHFLGGLAVAKEINRTLVLPPIHDYKNVPFDSYFQVEPLREYHRVITAENFLQHLAPTHWPPGKRAGFCYTGPNQSTCQVKQGTPHAPFWDEMNIDFDEIVAMKSAWYHLWIEEYPASKYPVMALRGAPAAYPVKKENRHLQYYLRFAEHIEEEAEHLISSQLPAGPYIGIHLRNGADWERACEHVDGTREYMSSPQCTDGPATKEICLPSYYTILRQVADVVERTGISTVFVATDKYPMTGELQEHLRDKATVYHLDPRTPMLDQAILIRSAHFIGNCVSSFTSFVGRTRDIRNLGETSFWGI